MSTHDLNGRSILLIISGGIAAYKSLDLIRLLKKSGAQVRTILTKGGEQFVTPLSVSALSGEEAFTDLWSLKDETEMGHIRLSREADLIVIAPASADIMAKMADGMANDLATTTLLAANAPILLAPAMNVQMWNNPATQANIAELKKRGITTVGPNEGEMACGEFGPGRMSEPEEILSAIYDHFFDRPLKGLHAIVTSGPTREPIDPVRFIGNHSSGKQGHAIAKALLAAGADVTLISGPVSIPDPSHVKTIRVETAQQMLDACEGALPADIAICAAAVCDWAPKKVNNQKLKKESSRDHLTIEFTKTPDILHTIAKHALRPCLVVGFAAETQDVIDNGRKKLAGKSCDIILANDVSGEKVFGKNTNHVHCLTATDTLDWGEISKDDVAGQLIRTICKLLDNKEEQENSHAAE